MNNYTVSVCMITYNHELYIQEALNGVFSQETNFDIEFVISNDASTDKTHNFVNAFSKSNNRITVKYFKHSKNIGMIPNFIFALKQCTGKYIALCEGDDYWTDPLKLQKQVDFLENNTDFEICFHESKIDWINENNASQRIKLNSEYKWNKMSVNKDVYAISDVLNGPFMATASVVFRNNELTFPSWFYKSASGDLVLYALVLGDKKIKFMNEVMSVYRRHSGGITRFHRGNSIILNRIKILNLINRYYKNKYLEYIKNATNNYLKNVIPVSLNELFQFIKIGIQSKTIENILILKLTKRYLVRKLKH